MKSSLMLICLVTNLTFSLTLFSPWSAHSQAQTSVNITTFNLKWFGIGGDPNTVQKEYRYQTIKKLIDAYLTATNIFVFEEVVVVSDLTKILPSGWQCISYAHPEPKHQYVAICAAPVVALAKVSYDNNFTIEEANVGNPRLRPAMRVDVVERKTNRNLFTLVGLHLKAMPDQSAVRIAQAQQISKDLARVPAGRPVVIAGDLNTFVKMDTKLPEDDVELILKSFNSVSKGFFKVPHKPNTYTFRSPQFRNQLDQFYVRGTMRVAAVPDVFPVCSATQNGSGYMNFEFYYKNVSDHCPVTMQIIVQ